MVLQSQFMSGFAKKTSHILCDHKVFGGGRVYDIIGLSDACMIFDTLVN